jgi:hypothetical protein
LPKPKGGGDFVGVTILLVAMERNDYYFPLWGEYQVLAKETHSTTVSIVTVRTSTPEDTFRFHRGIAFDWEKERIFGKNAIYTPLPPLDGQEPGYLRLLVHREEEGDVTKDAVDEKLTTNAALIRMAMTRWKKYCAPIPGECERLVVFASGMSGIGPMLQTIYTLLEARRGDGIKRRAPKIHVVWFKQNREQVAEDIITFSHALSSEASTADDIASLELERLRLAHPDKLVIELHDIGSTFAQARKFIESALAQNRETTFLEHVLGTSATKLLLISGSRDFAESLSRHEESPGFLEDGPTILSRAEQAGWRILDLSMLKVCT